MTRIEKSIVINAPPEKVFALLADLEHLPEWDDMCKEVKITSKERKGVGVTYYLVGVWSEYDGEVTEWVENERFAHRATCVRSGTKVYTSNTLEPVVGGTEFIYVIDFKLPYSILGKIIGKLKYSKPTEEGMEKAMQNLKNLLEKK